MDPLPDRLSVFFCERLDHTISITLSVIIVNRYQFQAGHVDAHDERQVAVWMKRLTSVPGIGGKKALTYCLQVEIEGTKQVVSPVYPGRSATISVTPNWRGSHSASYGTTAYRNRCGPERVGCGYAYQGVSRGECGSGGGLFGGGDDRMFWVGTGIWWTGFCADDDRNNNSDSDSDSDPDADP
ncbi:hypothetical protein [Cryobacterium sp. TMT3-29-2]|uniref:hypothetical protein n=1 Tax=Cryobacterium sp. TMT3-29-2 TaxID=2555867 RepID=UPI001431563F|nr:hypothetical protein [Cryobacterium sp. TMT3-29-2]